MSKYDIAVAFFIVLGYACRWAQEKYRRPPAVDLLVPAHPTRAMPPAKPSHQHHFVLHAKNDYTRRCQYKCKCGSWYFRDHTGEFKLDERYYQI